MSHVPYGNVQREEPIVKNKINTRYAFEQQTIHNTEIYIYINIYMFIRQWKIWNNTF